MDDASLCFVLWWMLAGTNLPDEGLQTHRFFPHDSRSLSMRMLPMFLCILFSHDVLSRIWWKEPRQRTQWNEIERGVWHMTPEYLDKKYRTHYRMSYGAFLYLTDQVTPFLRSQSRIFVRKPIEVERALAAVLYRLAQGVRSEEAADRFYMGASTVRKYMHLILDILCSGDKLFGHFIAIPSGTKLTEIIAGFQEKTGLPNCCGAIDGTHIPLSQKPQKPHIQGDYYSYKSRTSIILQGVCDTSRIFWNVCARAPGGTADGGHFRVSSLYDNMRHELVLNQPVLQIQGQRVRPYLVGDAAYGSRTWLVRPYNSRDRDPVKKRFDADLSRGRVHIEMAFGSLKNRWRILKNVNSRVEQAAKITVACCVLHNLCEFWKIPEPIGVDGRDPNPKLGGNRIDQRNIHEDESGAKKAGEDMRDALFMYWRLRNGP